MQALASPTKLHCVMEGACNHLQLLVARELGEVHGICRGTGQRCSTAQRQRECRALSTQQPACACWGQGSAQTAARHAASSLIAGSYHPVGNTAGTQQGGSLTAADADGEVGVALGVFHGIQQQLPAQHVNVDVVPTLLKVAVQHCSQVGCLGIHACLAQHLRAARNQPQKNGVAVIE